MSVPPIPHGLPTISCVIILFWGRFFWDTYRSSLYILLYVFIHTGILVPVTLSSLCTFGYCEDTLVPSIAVAAVLLFTYPSSPLCQPL